VRGVGSSNLPVPTIRRINTLQDRPSFRDFLHEGAFSCKNIRLCENEKRRVREQAWCREERLSWCSYGTTRSPSFEVRSQPRRDNFQNFLSALRNLLLDDCLWFGLPLVSPNFGAVFRRGIGIETGSPGAEGKE
jgi:hypothetical protein